MSEFQENIQFGPLSSSVSLGFWTVFNNMKLEVLGLDQAPVPAQASYANNNPNGFSASLTIEWNSLADKPIQLDLNHFCSRGKVINLNTLESFKQFDRAKLLQEDVRELTNLFDNGKILQNPSYFTRFLLLMFANLKSYQYYYWFAFPCLSLPDDVVFSQEPRTLESVYDQKVCKKISEEFSQFKAQHPQEAGYFSLFIGKENSSVEIRSLGDGVSHLNDGAIIGYADPWTKSKHPGWPARNLLAYLVMKKQFKNLKLLSLRSQKQSNIGHSVIYNITNKSSNLAVNLSPLAGWEKDDKGKLMPKFTNLKSKIDPKSLAESSVNLNLKLMKWRLVPSLDLQKFSDTRYLLLGSGTLGCNVARGLLGWGAKKITFVDNGKVSYSNPVRQSLFTFEDSLHGGAWKAEAAAKMLQKICPQIEADFANLNIPMPGHVISESLITDCKKNLDKLDELIQSHDVIFLLTDSRESRWLPTLLGSLYNKIVINAALGFDSFLVIRHGTRGKLLEPNTSQVGNKHLVPGRGLGCYFCNDVMAPGNSTRDRTLDQQCTVTRPGASFVAAGLAVELMASVLQHPLGAEAPAFTKNATTSEDAALDGLLGAVPHSIRGSLGSFHQFQLTAESFSNCTACCPKILESFSTEKFEFLKKVCGDPHYLEDVLGLTKLMEDTSFQDLLDWSEDDEEESS